MNLKKFFVLMLVALTAITSSCKYDDDELWDTVNSLAERINALETLTKQMNSDIAAMQSIISALEKNVYISEVEKLTDGYILHFTDGTTATIKNGTNGLNGKDAPVIDVKQENGVYYWTITVDGETTWLTDDKGNKLPVSGTDGENGTNGKNGVTPLLKVDGDGYWMVSYDNGSSYTYVLDSYGHKVYAVGPQGPAGSDGEDGKKGDDGEDGEDGDSMFSNVVEKDGKVIIILADGTVIEIPIAAKVSLYFDSAKKTQLENTNEIPLETPDGSTTLYYTLSNGTIELLPSGNVDAAINETDQSITFTAKAADLSNSKVIALIMNNGQTSTCIFKFKAISTEEGQNLTITTRDELAWFAAQVNEGKTFNGETVTLGNDIDLNNEAWTPIGLNADESKKFKGVFDGQGHIISNLKVNTEAGYTAAGFFGALDGTAKNFTIDGASINHISTGAASDNGIAVVAGSIYTSGSIEGVTVKNATVTGNRYLGGISGYTYGSVTNCTVENITLTATPDNQSGSYDNGDKVGGIAGYFASESIYQVANNKVSNVTIKGYRDLGGIVGCADGANYVTNNTIAGTNSITVDQVTNWYEDKAANAASVVGRITAGTLDNSNTVSGTVAITINKEEVSLADLSTAVASGGDVTLTGDVKGEAITTAPYGNKTGLIQNGGVIDGGGNTLSVECSGDDYGIMTTGGTIKNLIINDGSRAIVLYAPTEDVILDNVQIGGDGILYPLNTAEHPTVEGIDLVASNSTFKGWTSFAGIESASFTNCTFGVGTYGNLGWPYGSLLKPYINTTLKNCTFADKYYLDLSALGANCTVTLENCTVNGTTITENIVGTECNGTETFCVELPEGRTLADCVIFK